MKVTNKSLPFSADNFIDVYIKPWCRIGPYVVGIVTGYLLYISEKNAPRLHKVHLLLRAAVADNKNKDKHWFKSKTKNQVNKKKRGKVHKVLSTAEQVFA